MKHKLFLAIAIVFMLGSCRPASKDLPRGKASESITEAVEQFVAEAAKDTNWDLHSVMVLQHGKVLAEKWMSEGAPDKPHVMFSVSKTFTATAVGFAVSEGLLSVEDKLISFFPDRLPETMDENMKEVTVKDLLTMNVGMDREPRAQTRDSDRPSWVEGFFTAPVPNKPGTYFMYNSMATYMLSAIVQKVTGEKVNDYLTPRLWEPLGIEKPTFEESPEGINCGGWGLYLKTEDMAKMGQTLLDGGKYKGRQVIPSDWVEQMTTYKVPCQPAGRRPEDVPGSGLTKDNSDWVQGYCYQMWRCRHNAFRADGARGQYILVMPDVDAVVVITEFSKNLQKVLNAVWDIIYPALGGKSPEQANIDNMTKIYDFKALDNKGAEVDFAQYKGKVLMIVNTASKCGFTPQYDELEALWKKYGKMGLQIVGFPCDQFGHQEPGTDEEIAQFCRINHGVTFPLMKKIEVNGPDAHPIYKYLKSQKSFQGFGDGPKAAMMDKLLVSIDPDYKNNSEIKWNFSKFLISRDGERIERFAPTIPMEEVEKVVLEML